MESITDSDKNQAKRITNDFEIKNLDWYHDLYLKSDTLLLADHLKTIENYVYKFIY